MTKMNMIQKNLALKMQTKLKRIQKWKMKMIDSHGN